ncbi:uncharacterized protein K460DRAFT_367434 [Cucurbitaria berberidis CBS 394.84]|uniref:Uncharacterized protein n=1 Tax=Cucurbitaria berberidis CBS 394.84 TaxID=1168544 RepID=A0A9P4GJB7_9PLEO|nr:uncharacterized protein K460DRAFT_367434 [Cucurbitaria berberidis CBS 394.84]KAF1846692.1 hypothetical protein K460DRAFT_367434 [Cucurbitaria berberidis CBS 394.84]
MVSPQKRPHRCNAPTTLVISSQPSIPLHPVDTPDAATNKLNPNPYILSSTR